MKVGGSPYKCNNVYQSPWEFGDEILLLKIKFLDHDSTYKCMKFDPLQNESKYGNLSS